MYARIVPILLFSAIAIYGAAPAIAGSIGQELLDQVEKQKPAPTSAETNKGVPILKYLFIGQDNLEFTDDTPLDSGLMPASGDDPDIQLKPEQKSVLPKQD